MEFAPILHALSRNKIGALLIALQIALTMTIVTNAAFIIQQRSARIARPSGLDEANTFFVVVNAFSSGLDYRKLLRDDLDALEQVPGVQAVTTLESIPLSSSGWGSVLYIDPAQASNEGISYGKFMTNEHGIDAFGIELVAGRNFRPEEIVWRSTLVNPDATVILVSQSLADKLFPNGDALGKLVWDDPARPPAEIIGIYRRMQNAWPSTDFVEETGIVPFMNDSSDMRYFVRAEPGMRDEVMQRVEAQLAQNRDRLVRLVRAFEEQKKRTYKSDIAMVRLLTGVVVLLSTITAFGIVGLAWFSVTQRRKQIGTRRALGATRFDIMRHFMLENWLVTSMGLVLGVAGAVALNWFLDTEYQSGRMPLFYLPVGVVLLWLLGQLAVLLPARRAAGIPPALATRSV